MAWHFDLDALPGQMIREVPDPPRDIGLYQALPMVGSPVLDPPTAELPAQPPARLDEAERAVDVARFVLAESDRALAALAAAREAYRQLLIAALARLEELGEL